MTRSVSAAPAPTGPLGRPIGLQLYTVREQAAADLAGTLAAVAGMGYREVELAGLHGHDAQQVAAWLREHALSAPAAHYSMFELSGLLAEPGGGGFEQKLADLNTLGTRYLVCSFPGTPDPDRLASRPGGPGAAILRGELTLDEWRWNAEQLGRIAEAAADAGLLFAYHNHAMEFADYDGTAAFDELLRLTDAGRVFFEVDCAWVARAGRDPAELVAEVRNRVRLLHVKDLDAAADEFRTVPVGRGSIDWPAVFGAVDPERLEHYFVEQEHFTQTPLQAVAESIRYLEQLGRN